MRARFWTSALLFLLVAALTYARWARRVPKPVVLPAVANGGEPQLMLWAWETPQDLRALDPAKAGVAFLAREVLVGKTAEVRPRRQPLAVAPGAWVMAVVRIETRPGFVASDALAAEVVAKILPVLAEKSVRGLQVDFDATADQRVFYAKILRALRVQMPAGMPLSVTALVSWCGRGSWLPSLPVDEAVPMFFRMGGPRGAAATETKPAAGVSEPLCARSVGVSTDETWPPIDARQRVYVFNAGSFTQQQLARAGVSGYEGLRGPLSP